VAELLVRIEDRGDGLSFAGDVIHVADDGWTWGRMETKPPFRVVKVPGAARERFLDMLEPLRSADGGSVAYRARYFVGEIPDEATIEQLDAMRRYRINPGVIG
jgi:hypothetical protein